MSKVWVLFLFVFLTAACAAQTSVTAAVVDSGGTAWAGGAWSAFYYNSNPDQPPLAAGQSFVQALHGTLDASGAFATSLTSTSSLAPFPAGSGWIICVADITSSPHTYCTRPLAVVGDSQSLTSAIAAVVRPPRLTCGTPVIGYGDVEIANPIAGCSYYNLTTMANRCYVSGAWGACGPAQTNPSKSPTGACTSLGVWMFSQDGHATFCDGTMWVTKI